MSHHFNEFVAIDYGVTEAILLDNIYYWVKQNEAGRSKKHYHHGKYWTFNSAEKFTNYMKYFNKRQIEYAIKKLEKKGLIKISRFNLKKYDRTRWYTITDKTLSYYEPTKLQNCNMSNEADYKLKKESKDASSDKLQICHMEVTNLSHGCYKICSPIPSVNSSINSDIYMAEKFFLKNEERKKPPTLDEIESFIAEKELSINAKDFYDHYCNNEWIDSQGKLITKSNYRLKVSMWAKNNFQSGSKTVAKVEPKRPDSKVYVAPTENSCGRINIDKDLMMLQAAAVREQKCSANEVLKLTKEELKAKFTYVELIRMGIEK